MFYYPPQDSCLIWRDFFACSSVIFALRHTQTLISYTWLTSKVQWYLCACTSLPPCWKTHLNLSAWSAHTSSVRMCAFLPQANTPFSLHSVCYAMYYSTSSFWVTVLFVHLRSLPQSVIHFLLPVLMNIKGMSKTTLLWRRTKNHANLHHVKQFFLFLLCLDCSYSILYCTLNLLIFFPVSQA